MFCGRIDITVWPASKYYCAGFCVWGRPFLSSIFIEMGLGLFFFSKLIYFYYEKKMKRKNMQKRMLYSLPMKRKSLEKFFLLFIFEFNNKKKRVSYLFWRDNLIWKSCKFLLLFILKGAAVLFEMG